MILDGWGLSSSWSGNPIAMSNPPNITNFWRVYPHKVLLSFGQESGRQVIVSNSRLAHMEISAGREVLEDLEIINGSIANKSFYRNQVLLDCFRYAHDHNSNIHFMGLISDAGYNASLEHLIALLEMAHRQNFSRVYVDAITDGVDSKTPALKFVENINKKFREIGFGQFSSVVGRRYVLTSTKNPDPLIKFSDLIFHEQGAKADSIQEAMTKNYTLGRQDEEIEPTLIKIFQSVQTIKAYDCVVIFNLRGENSRALVDVLTGSLHRLFWEPKLPKELLVATFTKYSKRFTSPVAFPREPIADTLPEVFARYQKRNLRLAETLKKPHVTTYFNGGREEPLAGEERKIIPSSRPGSFDQAPELSLAKISQETIGAILSKKYDFIVINFANADTIGHTGNLAAATQAVKALDRATAKIVEANLKVGGSTIITADHGNIEQMIRTSPRAHTKNPVPFILVAKERRKNLIQGALSIPYSTLSKIVTAQRGLVDIAPTILELMNLPKPEAMTGHSLLRELE